MTSNRRSGSRAFRCAGLPARLARFTVVVGLAALVVAGPARAAAPGVAATVPDTTTPARRIGVWTHSAEGTAEFEVLREAAVAFNRAQVEYRAEVYPSINRNYEDRVHSAAATGSLPCVLEVDGPFLYAFAWSGYLQPLDRFVSPALLADFLPSVVAQGTYEGQLYSLGQFDSGLALWGNRRHLRAAGVRIPTVEAPWSLAEFEHALERVTALDDVDYALSFNVHVRTNEFYSYAFAPILQGFGGDLVDRQDMRSARGVLDGVRSVAAMRRFQHWFARGWTRAVFDRADDFDTGRAALSWIGHWKYAAYRRALGDDLVLIPMPDFGRGITTGMGSWNWAMSSTCRHPGGAWKFLERLLSTKEILRMTAANGAVPARQSALARSSLYGPGGPLRVFARQLETGAGVPRPATPGYGSIRNAFSRAVGAIIVGADVESELARAAAAIDDDFAKHQGYQRP